MTKHISSILPKIQGQGVQDENLHSSNTSKACLATAKTWKDMLHSKKIARTNALAARLASLALSHHVGRRLACYDFVRADLGSIFVKAYVFLSRAMCMAIIGCQ